MVFKKAKADVLPILKENEAARCDDMILYSAYVYEKVKDLKLGYGWLQKIFADRRLRISCGIATYDTIGRVRRKLQEENPELRPSENIVKEKKLTEHKYREQFRKKV